MDGVGATANDYPYVFRVWGGGYTRRVNLILYHHTTNGEITVLIRRNSRVVKHDCTTTTVQVHCQTSVVVISVVGSRCFYETLERRFLL